MRDHLLLYVNGQRLEIRGDDAFASLTDFLRGPRQLTGTKVVCAEGDCGACTVLIGKPDGDGLKYVTVDACIQFLYQLDGRHVVTVEGLHGSDGKLHPIQEAMVACHGSQCGFCTPGFVMALAGRAEQRMPDLRTSLTGNLCRCTGYVSILEAAMAIDDAAMSPLAEQYPDARIAADLANGARDPVRIETNRVFFGPRTLADAVAFKTQQPKAADRRWRHRTRRRPGNKAGLEPAAILCLTNIPGLGSIETSDSGVSIGANATWTEIETFAKETWPEFWRIIIRFGSPQIRNVATLIANIANGSPIADSLPFLAVMEAELDLLGAAGPRTVKLVDFYRGYKLKDLAPDEIITRVRIPHAQADESLKLYKVSRRNDLDIATFGAAIRVRRVGDVVSRAYVAYAGVAPTIDALAGAAEAFLQGKRFTAATRSPRPEPDRAEARSPRSPTSAAAATSADSSRRT